MFITNEIPRNRTTRFSNVEKIHIIIKSYYTRMLLLC